MNSIWKYFDNYKVHCDNMKLANKIAGWKDCIWDGIYFYSNHKEADVVFPGKLYNRVAELLNLPLKGKSMGRIDSGHKMSRNLKVSTKQG